MTTTEEEYRRHKLEDRVMKIEDRFEWKDGNYKVDSINMAALVKKVLTLENRVYELEKLVVRKFEMEK